MALIWSTVTKIESLNKLGVSSRIVKCVVRDVPCELCCLNIANITHNEQKLGINKRIRVIVTTYYLGIDRNQEHSLIEFVLRTPREVSRRSIKTKEIIALQISNRFHRLSVDNVSWGAYNRGGLRKLSELERPLF